MCISLELELCSEVFEQRIDFNVSVAITITMLIGNTVQADI